MSTKSKIEKGKEMVSDAAITTAIKAKLIKEIFEGAREVHVETTKGVVTLTGKVHSEKEIEQVKTIAKSTSGVKRVISKLQLSA